MVGLKENVKEKQAGSHLDMSKDGNVFLQARWQKSSKLFVWSASENREFSMCIVFAWLFMYSEDGACSNIFIQTHKESASRLYM